MSNAKTIKSFVKQFVAIIKGDDAQAQGEKVFRQAQSGLNTHISNLNGELVDCETRVEDAKEALGIALVNNGKTISDRGRYVSDLLNAKNTVTAAEEVLEKHKAKIEFLVDRLKELEAEVSIDEEVA